MSATRPSRRWALPLVAAALGCAAFGLLPKATAQTLPGPPPLPPASAPQSTQPALTLVSPLAPYSCGTAGSVATLVEEQQSGSATNQIADVAPYLADAFMVCGMIPSPTSQTTCQFDKELSQAASGAPQAGQGPAPAPAGTTVDLVKAVESFIATETGQPVPVDVADQLSASLSCTTADLTTPPSSAGDSPELTTPDLGADQSAGGLGGTTTFLPQGGTVSASSGTSGQPAQLAAPPRSAGAGPEPVSEATNSFTPAALMTSEGSALLGALAASAITMLVWYRRIRLEHPAVGES